MSKKKKLILLLAAGLILLAAFGGLCYKKRRGIYNTYMKMTGQTIPYRVKEAKKKAYGYYETVVNVDMDLKDTAEILENDDAASSIETSIPVEQTLVAESYQIDELLEDEVQAGYDWEDPMVIQNPYQISPLTAVIIFDTEQECAVRYTVQGKTDAADLTQTTDAVISHRVPVIGLYPGMENVVLLELLDANGNVTESQEIRITTEELPEKLKDVIDPVQTAGESAYGLTIVYGQKTHLPFAYDCMGDIRWYMSKETANYGLYLLSNGRMIFQDTGAYVPSPQKPQSTNLYEIDYLGRAFRMYYIPGGNHHEVIEKTPGGNLLLLSSSMDLHYEEEILEIDRETGEIVNCLDLQEIFGTTFVDRDDWAHINTVSYQEEDDTILISARNIESAIKINWSTHKLVWILCDPRFYEGTKFEKYVLTPTEDFVYHFQQHTAYQLETDLDGNPDTVEISMFDNHYVGERKKKVDYYDNHDNSYLLVYSIDEEAKTVSQIKRIPTIFSKITSSAIYEEESGHFFGMCGWVPYAEDGRKGMTYEFDYETEEVLNQYSIKTTFYRAEEMVINMQDLSSKMEISEQYIAGELWQPVKTKKKISAPEQTLGDEVSFKLIGSVLYVNTLDHRISQIIFKGAENTYVYDTSSIHLHDEDYLVYTEDIPVPLRNMDSDEYQIWCVYEDVLYETGQSFKK